MARPEKGAHKRRKFGQLRQQLFNPGRGLPNEAVQRLVPIEIRCGRGGPALVPRARELERMVGARFLCRLQMQE